MPKTDKETFNKAMRTMLLLLMLCLIPASLSCRERQKQGGRVTISVWHVWGGTLNEGLERLKADFERAHPDIELNMVFTSNNLSTNQKFFTAVAAGKPPDVVFVDGPQVASWAEWGALAPLTERMKEAGISSDDYFAPCWRQNAYEGNVWALTFCADPNFAFAWNKESFRQAGLDPDRPPRTFEELDAYAERLTIREGDRLMAIGFIPWAQYGMANSMFTFAWAFGGDFYDYEKRRITAHDPGVMRALEWMVSYAKKYDVTRVSSLQQGFGTQEQNPFITGQVAMQCLHLSEIQNILRYAPQLDYGLSSLPTPAGGEERSSWVGGWCLAIPKGAQHPDEAWEFLRWACHDPDGTTSAWQNLKLLPGVKDAPCMEEIRKDPRNSVFLKIMEECRHQRPVMPAQALFMRELDRAVSAAIHGKKSPRNAVEEASNNTQRELDLILAGHR